MIVPLRARGRVIGDLALAMAESGRRYGEEDLALAQQLADRCALALDNARLYAELHRGRGRRAHGRARRSTRSSAASPTRSPPRRPTARWSTPTTPRCGDPGYDSVEELLSAAPGQIAAPLRDADEDGGPLVDRAAPGAPRDGRRDARAADRAQPHGRHPRVALVAREGDAGASTPDGSVRLAINVIEDITELKRAEQGQRFLAEAGRVLAGSLDYEETLAAVARLAVPDIADWCAVDVLVDGEFKRVATAHVDPRQGRRGARDRRALPARPGVAVGGVRRAAQRPLGGLSRDHRRAARARPRRTRSTSRCCARSA